MRHVMDREHRRSLMIGGACGIASVLMYLAVVSFAPADTPSQARVSVVFVLATGWPLLGVVYSYALYRLIAMERQGIANRMAFVLSLFGLATVTAMISVQLAVQFGVHELQTVAGERAQADWASLLAALRLVDLGLDLAWDVFIGWSMIVAALPMFAHGRLGPLWALPSFVLGALLIGLNAATFPWPPVSRGLFDVGPVVGLYMLLLAARMVALSRARTSAPP